MKDIAAEFFTLLVFSYRDGMEGVEHLIRNRLVSWSLVIKFNYVKRP